MKLTWILVADNTHARIFMADTPSSKLEELEDLTHTEGRLHDREMTTDLPGRIKCVFRSKVATYSGRMLPLIPFQSCHPFR